MQISFGKKIPISTCNIYNKEAQKYERATLYEIDCKDEEDINYLNNIEGKWEYKDAIAYLADFKHIDANDINHEKIGLDLSGYKIYSLETQGNHVACMCETHPLESSQNIEIIESNPDKKYKYSGQAMLASIAKQIFPQGLDLEVLIPVAKSESFYSEACKFPRNDSAFGYCLKNQKLRFFIERVEGKIQGKILDVKI